MIESRPTYIIQLGYGKVGTPLVRLAIENRDRIEAETGVQLRHAAVLRSSSILLGDDRICRAADRGPAFADWTPHAPVSRLTVLDTVFRCYGTPDVSRYVLVDATATEQTSSLLLEALAAGIAVVTANKIPLAETPGWFEQMQTISRTSHTPFRYECTVGGSLPVISTLLDLLHTGDTVHRITALSSSSLSCIMGNVNRGLPVGAAIDDAIRRGFAEPNPLTDLAGRDALRKTVILAKTMGLPVTMDDVRQEPLLDRDYTGFQDFRENGGEFALADRLVSARRPGTVIYYVGTIDADGPVTLNLQSFPHDSIWGTLEPSENLFLFATERFGDVSVVVRGVGGGPILTASGILADIIKVAQAL